MDPTLCKHEVRTLLPSPQRVRRARGSADQWHGGLCAVRVAQVWVKVARTHGICPCQIIVVFSKQKNACKLEAQTCSRVILTDPPCTFLCQHPMSFSDRRQPSQTLVPRRCKGRRPLFLCFRFLGKCHQPCRNGGKCTGKNKCKCSKGYQGDLCSKRKYQSHSLSPCYRSIKLTVQYLFTVSTKCSLSNYFRLIYFLDIQHTPDFLQKSPHSFFCTLSFCKTAKCQLSNSSLVIEKYLKCQHTATKSNGSTL